MFDWVLGTAVTVSIYVFALWAMARHYRRQAIAAYEQARRNITRMADESIAAANARAAVLLAPPEVVVTLHIQNDTPQDPARTRSAVDAILAQLADRGITARAEVSPAPSV